MATSSWELSPLYRHSSTLLFPSPSTLIVSSNSNRIILRTTDDLQIRRTWTLPLTVPTPPAAPKSTRDRDHNSAGASAAPKPAAPPPDLLLTSFSISPAAPHLILAFAAKDKVAFILHPEQDEPVARIDIGAEGAVGMAWSGKGDTVMSWSASHLRLSLYRVANPSPALHIHHPKLAHPFGYSFRPNDGCYLAVAERHSGKDHIGIYDCVGWKLIRHFPLPSPSSDIADLAWSPCGRFIAVWEVLTDYILHIYTPDGRLLKTFTPYSSVSRPPGPTNPAPRASGGSAAAAAPRPEDSTLPERERAREERSTEGWVGLGIRKVEWHPTGDWIAVGGWDGKIRILTRLAWAPVAELSVPVKVSAPMHVWQEPTEWIERTRGKGIVPFDAQALPYNPTAVRPDLGRPNPKMGIASMSWSPTGRWLAVWNQTYPTTILLFSFISSPTPHFHPRLHSLVVHYLPVRAFEWQPVISREQESEAGAAQSQQQELLAISTGEKGFTMWREPRPDVPGEEDGLAECVGVPSHAPFAPHLLRFSAPGDALLLADKGTFAIAYPVSDGDEGDQNAEAERTWVEE